VFSINNVLPLSVQTVPTLATVRTAARAHPPAIASVTPARVWTDGMEQPAKQSVSKTYYVNHIVKFVRVLHLM